MNSQKNAKVPIVRVSKGRFSPDRYAAIRQLNEESAASLIPAIGALDGLLYYHAGVDPETNTLVNVSVWRDLAAAKQMETLAAMLAQRPIFAAAGVEFDAIANCEPGWKIQSSWACD